jgi:hypothetical protein
MTYIYIGAMIMMIYLLKKTVSFFLFVLWPFSTFFWKFCKRHMQRTKCIVKLLVLKITTVSENSQHKTDPKTVQSFLINKTLSTSTETISMELPHRKILALQINFTTPNGVAKSKSSSYCFFSSKHTRSFSHQDQMDLIWRQDNGC